MMVIVGEYLHRWGFTPQKPVKKAYEQQPERVRKWVDEEYPGIARKAREQKAEILWGKVRKWIDKHKDKIKIFFLPPYSP